MDDPAENQQSKNEQANSLPSPDLGIGNKPPRSGQKNGIEGSGENDPEQRPRKWRDVGIDRKIELALAAALVLFGAAQIVVTLVLNSGTSKQVDKIIKAADGIGTDANEIQQSANSFAVSAGDINSGVGHAVTKLQLQVDQVKRSANAADKTANTANETLHVSERAYLFPETPKLDPTTSILFLPITNIGHIPAKNVRVTVHVLKTSKLPNGMFNATYRWFQRDFPEVWPGEPLSVGGVTIDQERTKKAEDVYTFGVTVEYNDGFSDSKRQKREDAFCMSHLKNDHIGYGPCMVTNTLDMLRHGDQYPNPKYEQP